MPARIGHLPVELLNGNAKPEFVLEYVQNQWQVHKDLDQ